MSRSRRKPIIKDNANTSDYWKPIRREWKQHLKKNHLNEDLYLRNRREIHNDWNFYDWKSFICDDEEPCIMEDGEVIMIGSSKKDVELACRK